MISHPIHILILPITHQLSQYLTIHYIEGGIAMNANGRTASYCVAVAVFSVILSLFYFSYSQSASAVKIGHENRERLAVVEAEFKQFSTEIRSRLEELRVDIKQLLKEKR